MGYIEVIEARQHNLKNVSCRLPRNQLVVLTGPSGSGKSSLAFDTLYAEGQRRYVEALSPHARQFLERLPRPDVQSVEGLTPAIAIRQQAQTQGPRSTVGTTTEIADYLRLLFARVGTPLCPVSGRSLRAYTPAEIADFVITQGPDTRVVLLAPIIRKQRVELEPIWNELRADGFVRVRLGGVAFDLGDAPPAQPEGGFDLEVVVDRLVIREGIRSRLSDSVELALRRGGGTVLLDFMRGEPVCVMSDHLVSWEHGVILPRVEPRLFSFNSPQGACPTCNGLGVISPEGPGRQPPSDESPSAERALDDSETDASPLVPEPCPSCAGTRLRPEASWVTLGGHSIASLAAMPLRELQVFLKGLPSQLTSPSALSVALPLIRSIEGRLGFLLEVGLHYLSLCRSTQSLSGGEAQRIRLATQLGAQLSGVLYVLDEPSAGLHARDSDRLLQAIRALIDQGNSVVMIEHHRNAILAADYLVDMGPGAGELGGRILAQGAPREVLASPNSCTAPYLSYRKRFVGSWARKARGPHNISITGATVHNLKGVTCEFPVGVLTVVTGVSGSGKSSLVLDTLLAASRRKVYGAKVAVGECDGIDGLQHFDKVISIDQSPIGRSPRSTPATYAGILSELRMLYAALPDARARGYGSSRFSYNVKGGRCEGCRGDGQKRVEMHFLPDVYVTCDLCDGRRYNPETLAVTYRGMSIFDALQLTVDAASLHFENVPRLNSALTALRQVGLGYIRLGQSATTLSGGEAQRLKLATELSKSSTGNTLYVLDEPTTGLHFSDTERLLASLFALRDAGNTVILVEHNIDVIECADWIVDMGPGGGSDGGEVIAVGTPELVAAHPGSHTGYFLAQQQHAAAKAQLA